MKYLKRFNESVDNQSIEELCKKYLDTEKNKDVEYEIQNDEVVITNDPISILKVLQLDLEGLDGFPFKIKNVNTLFVSGLTSLKNSPDVIEYSINIYDSDVTSLEGGPKYVGRFYHINGTSLESFEGLARPLKTSYKMSILDTSLKELLNTFLTLESSGYYDITEENHHWFEILSEYDPIRPDRELILDLFNGFLEEIRKEPLNEKQLNNLKKYWKLI